MASTRIYQTTQWSAGLTGYYSVAMGSALFGYEGAGKAYSISSKAANTVRFELRDGDQHWWDRSVGTMSERNELASRGNVAANNTPLHVSYGFTLEPGAPNTAKWMVLGQLHQNLEDTTATGGPSFSIGMDGNERMTVFVRYSGDDGKTVVKTVWADVYDIQRGHEYQMDIKAVTDPTGQNGRLVVVRDGVTIVDYSGKFGTANQTGVYWAEGIYREGSATETVAATYSNLQISTGDSVSIPGSAAYIGAPVLAVGAIGAGGMTLTGTAKLGTTVTVYDGKVAVGSGVVDAGGHVSIALATPGAGTHAYYAVATETSGRSGVIATPVDVVVGTAASIAAQIGTLAADTALKAIHVTDSKVLGFTSVADLNLALRSPIVSAALASGTQLRVTETITGKAYDQEVRTYDMAGTLLDMQRSAGGKVTMATVIKGTTTTMTTWNADGSHAVQILVGGKITQNDLYNSAGVHTQKQSFFADGSKEVDTFNAIDGSLQRVIATKADGARTDINYGITGKAYVTQAIAYDKAGAVVSTSRYDANGHVVWTYSTAGGLATSYTYDAAGKATGYKAVALDGSSSVTTYAADGVTIARTDHYSVKGALLKTDLSNPAGASLAAAHATLPAVEPVIEHTTTVPAPTPTPTPTPVADTTPVVVAPAPAEPVTAPVPAPAPAPVTTPVVVAPAPAEPVTAPVPAAAEPVVAAPVQAPAPVDVATAPVQAPAPQTPVVLPTPVAPAPPAVLTVSTLASGEKIATGTIAQILGGIATLAQTSGLAKITATDAGIVDVASQADLNRYLRHASTLQKLDDTIQLRVSDTVTGKAYDKEVRTYDTAGTLGHLQRYAAGTLTMDTTVHGAWTVTTTWNADGTHATTASSGKTYTSETFNAAGRVTGRQSAFADGSKMADTISAVDGKVLKSVVVNADGSRLDTLFGVTGKDYVQQSALTGADGKATYLGRYDAAGHLVMASDLLAGTTATFAHDAAGKLVSARVVKTDGTYSVTTFDAGIATTDYFSARSALLREDHSDPAAALATTLAARIAANAHMNYAGLASGTDGNDTLTAAAGTASVLTGHLGNDTLTGGSGNDILIGGAGTDVLTGGGGKNLFYFQQGDLGTTHATADRITDFAQGDRIDISSLANLIGGHAGFTLIGGSAFDGHAGQVQVIDDGANTFVSGDLNGDRVADFMIRLDGHHALTVTDFVL